MVFESTLAAFVLARQCLIAVASGSAQGSSADQAMLCVILSLSALGAFLMDNAGQSSIVRLSCICSLNLGLLSALNTLVRPVSNDSFGSHDTRGMQTAIVVVAAVAALFGAASRFSPDRQNKVATNRVTPLT